MCVSPRKSLTFLHYDSLAFFLISFSDVIVLRSIWSTWVTKDTIQGAKRVLITLSGGGWSRVHYLRNDPSCFLRPSSRSPREVFFAPRLSILFDWKLRVEGMNDESKLPHNNSDRSTTALVHFTGNQFFPLARSMEFFLHLWVHLSKSVTFSSFFFKVIFVVTTKWQRSWRASNLEKFWKVEVDFKF